MKMNYDLYIEKLSSLNIPVEDVKCRVCERIFEFEDYGYEYIICDGYDPELKKNYPGQPERCLLVICIDCNDNEKCPKSAAVGNGFAEASEGRLLCCKCDEYELSLDPEEGIYNPCIRCGRDLGDCYYCMICRYHP